jgi:hypothetical protein
MRKSGCVVYNKLLESRFAHRLPPGLERGPIALGLPYARYHPYISAFIHGMVCTLPGIYIAGYTQNFAYTLAWVYPLHYIHYGSHIMLARIMQLRYNYNLSI